jgi:hypothetical protein
MKEPTKGYISTLVFDENYFEIGKAFRMKRNVPPVMVRDVLIADFNKGMSEMIVFLFDQGELSKDLIDIRDYMEGKFEFLELDTKE